MPEPGGIFAVYGGDAPNHRSASASVTARGLTGNFVAGTEIELPHGARGHMHIVARGETPFRP